MAKFFATMEMVLAQGVRILHTSYETGKKLRMNHGPGGDGPARYRAGRLGRMGAEEVPQVVAARSSLESQKGRPETVAFFFAKQKSFPD